MTTELYDPESAYSRAKLAAKLTEALEAAGFEKDPGARGEVTYRRQVETRGVAVPNTFVLIYTTIPTANPTEVRELGTDAIRTVAVYRAEGKPARPLIKGKRVFRSGKSTIEAIVERTLERARGAWRDVLARPRCHDCGAPKFRSRNDNDVCAAVCWAQDR